jgi:hypothetical protein
MNVSGSRRKTTEAPPPDEDPLSDSPFEGDLAAELAAAPRPRRKVPSVTVLLAAGLLVVAGFLGGIQADKHWGANRPTDASDILNRLRRGGGGNLGGLGGGNSGGGNLGGGNFGGGNLGGGQRGGQAGAGTSASGDATTGTVKLVDGDIIYVQTATGVVRVKTTGSTKVTVAKKAKPADIKAGSSVVVQGTPGQDGSVTATSVGAGR